MRYFDIRHESLLCYATNMLTATSLLNRLMNDVSQRYTSDRIRTHPFFRGLNWDLLRTYTPPFVPDLKSITDTTYFSIEDMAGVPQALSTPAAGTAGDATMDLYRNPNKDLAFVGYTYKRWETLQHQL